MTPLHHFGDFLRELLLSVPLPVVRVLFLSVPIALLLWVISLPREATTSGDGGHGRDLKLWAALALLVQVVIYSVF